MFRRVRHYQSARKNNVRNLKIQNPIMYTNPRSGDIKHSRANITRAKFKVYKHFQGGKVGKEVLDGLRYGFLL